MCSEYHNSILYDSFDGIRYFKWDRLFHELSQGMPTLIKLLLSLLHGCEDGKRVILISVIASMILKQRNNKLALLQRTISVLLYGKGCSKQVVIFLCIFLFIVQITLQVYNCLQSLMITLSYTGTIKLIDRLSEDHDIKVQYWCHDLLENLKVYMCTLYISFWYFRNVKHKGHKSHLYIHSNHLFRHLIMMILRPWTLIGSSMMIAMIWLTMMIRMN